MKKRVIKLYFTFENCIIKYLFVFYRTRNSSNSTSLFHRTERVKKKRKKRKLLKLFQVEVQMYVSVYEMNIKSLSYDEFISCS